MGRGILFHSSPCFGGRKCAKMEKEEKKQEEAALFASQSYWERRAGNGIQRTRSLNEEQQKI